MSSSRSLICFSALSHPVRLAIFRQLAANDTEIIPAGELALEFKAPASTMSGHLQTLEQAGLIKSERRSRNICYSLDKDGAQDLVRFLTEDCLKMTCLEAEEV